MTPHSEIPNIAAVASDQPEAAGAPECIHISPAMIQAGRDVLNDGFTIMELAAGDVNPAQVVVDVYLAMVLASRA